MSFSHEITIDTWLKYEWPKIQIIKII